MSAIFGLHHVAAAPDLPAWLQRMDAAMAPHGVATGTRFTDGPVALGHRLQRFTPEDAAEHQPLRAGPLTLVADARLSNRAELVAALGLGRDLPDSAVILAAFERWGEDCLAHLIGEFAFAVWDARTRRLFAARSRMGARMLFYHHAGPLFAFATTPIGILAVPAVPRDLDERKVAGSLVSATRDPTLTFFRGIRRLPPAHCLTLEGDRLTVRRYWQPDTAHTIRFARDDHYVEAFTELYDRVVADALRSTTPVALMLSGGLDSSSIAAMAAGRGASITSFTEVPRAGFTGAVPDGWYADESDHVRQIARAHPSIDALFLPPDPGYMLDGVEAIFDLTGTPLRAVSNRGWYEAALAGARDRGLNVMLTGEQGNLTATWNGAGLLGELLRDGRPGRLICELRAMCGAGGVAGTLRTLLGQAVRASGARLFPQSWRVDPGLSPINPALLEDTGIRAAIGTPPGQAARSLRQMRHDTLVAPDMSGVFVAAHRAHYGVDLRLPLGDQRLVDFCLALPEDQQRREGEKRWLIRRAMAGRLPSEVIANRRRGYQAAGWYEQSTASLPAIRADLDAATRSPLARHMIDLPRLQRMVDRWPTQGWERADTMVTYRTILPQGLAMTRFLRWYEAGGGGPA